MIGSNDSDKLMKQIQNMRSDLDNNRNLINGFAAKLLENFFINSLPYVVFLLSSDLLPRIFAKVSQKQRQLPQNKKEQLQQELAKIVLICQDEAPKFFDTLCKPYIHVIDRIVEKYNRDDLLKNCKYNTPREQFTQMIQSFIKAKVGNIEHRKDIDAINVAINEVNQYQKKMHAEIYEQISINWLKSQIDQLRQCKQFMCCRLFFGYRDLIAIQKEEMFIMKQYPKEEIKYKVENNSYKQVKESDKISNEKQDIARSIRNLMNKRGGVILLGTKYLSAKRYLVEGAQLDDKTKIATLSFIKQALNQVLPKHGGFELQSTKQVQISNHYQINPYISLQFIRLSNASTYFYHGSKQYIVRVTVKTGHPKYCYYILYQFLNDKKQAIIQFANTVENQQNKVQSIQDYHGVIYSKLVNFQEANKEKKIKREKIHDSCRVCMDLDVDLLDIDRDQDY